VQLCIGEAASNQAAKIPQAPASAIAAEGSYHVPGVHGRDHPELTFLLDIHDVRGLDQVPIGESTMRPLPDMAKDHAYSVQPMNLDIHQKRGDLVLIPLAYSSSDPQ
jgi:hypothetical protein